MKAQGKIPCAQTHTNESVYKKKIIALTSQGRRDGLFWNRTRTRDSGYIKFYVPMW